jgi:hypothetical protein
LERHFHKPLIFGLFRGVPVFSGSNVFDQLTGVKATARVYFVVHEKWLLAILGRMRSTAFTSGMP